MKVLLCVLLMCFIWTEVFSQPLKIAVGDDSLLATYSTGSGTKSCNCMNPRVDGICNYSILGPARIIYPFYFLQSAFRVKPDSVGFYSDTIFITYFGDSPNCDKTYYQCSGCENHTDYHHFEIEAIFDNNIKIHTYFYNPSEHREHITPTVSFLIDTTTRKYFTASISVEIYNNKSATTTFTDWKITSDSSQSLSFNLAKDSLPVSTFIVDPNRYVKDVLLNFATSLLPSPDHRSFAGKVQCHAHFNGKDSVCLIPLTFIFEAVPKSGVTSSGINSNFIEVYPNPSNGTIHVFCKSKSSSNLHLHIFNELGQDIMTVYDGILPEGKRDFSFKLSPGMYYVRMETAEGVVTKKVVVE